MSHEAVGLVGWEDDAFAHCEGSSYDIVANVLDCDVVVNKIELQSGYVHFVN